MDPIIEVTIAPDGKITIEGKGFKAAACEKATAALEKALGKTVSDHRTSEYYGDGEKVTVSR